MSSTFFLGHSEPSKEIARLFQSSFSRKGITALTTDGIFMPGSYSVDDLIAFANKAQAAVFVFTENDFSIFKKDAKDISSLELEFKENVIFELGVFMGILGRNRCFICVPRNNENVRLPSHINFINHVQYDHNDENPSPHYDSTCKDIIDHLNKNNLLYPEDRRERIVQTNEINVGILKYPPFCDYTIDKNSKIRNVTGLYVDIIKEIARVDNQRKINWIPVIWNEFEYALDNTVDVIISVFDTLGRSNRMLFCSPIHTIPIGGVISKEKWNKIKVTESESINGLIQENQNIRIGLIKGEVGWEYAKLFLDLKNPTHGQKYLVLEHTNIMEVFKLLNSDQDEVDVVFADSYSCHKFCKSNEDFIDPFTGHFDEVWGENTFMVRQDQLRLKEWFNDKIRQVTKARRFISKNAMLMKEMPEYVVSSLIQSESSFPFKDDF